MTPQVPNHYASRHAEDAEDGDISSDDARRGAIAATIEGRIRAAKEARQASGIEQIWQEDTDQYNGIDALSANNVVKDPSKPAVAPHSDGQSRVFLNITKPKCDAIAARTVEIVLPTDDKPWEIEPTPIPELADAAEAGDQSLLTLADGSQATAEDVATATMVEARLKSEKMADWIEDQFVEGDGRGRSVYGEMRRVVADAARIGTGVLKGPFPIERVARKWDQQDGVTALQIVREVAPTSKRVDVRDVYPDPACGENIHNGSYICERDYLTARQLQALARLDGYDRAAIAQGLREGPQSKVRDRETGRTSGQAGVTIESDVFEVWYYYGDMSAEDVRLLRPELLEMAGAAAGEVEGEEEGKAEWEQEDDEAYLTSIPVVATMLNCRPIKLSINPLESGGFPYDFVPWDPIEDQPYGRGVPRKMGVAQRMLNASVRALLRNAGLSAGAQIAVTKGALTPANTRYEIVGDKLWFFEPNEVVSDIRQAMQVWTIPSAQKELSAIVAFALQMADELTNFPMLMQGGQGGQQGATTPDTLGATVMLVQNASAPLRVLAKQFDDCLFSPHLTRYYEFGMQDAPDDCKGDMQVKARGSTALLQRALAKDFLMQIYPLSQDPKLKINPEKLASEMARSNGFSLASVQYTEDEVKAQQEQEAQNPPPGDPRIEAARIRAESEAQRMQATTDLAVQEMQMRQAEGQQDRELKQMLAQVEKDLEIMRLSGQENISIASIKGMLAKTAIDSRDKRDLFQAEAVLKMSPANPTNQGI